MPPLKVPYDQVSPMLVPNVTSRLLVRLIGALGIVRMIAPLAVGEDVSEEPYMLRAETVAVTVEPQGRLKGAAIRLAIGTEQVLAETTAAEVPSQLVKSTAYVKPLACRILIE